MSYSGNIQIILFDCLAKNSSVDCSAVLSLKENLKFSVASIIQHIETGNIFENLQKPLWAFN